MRWRREYVTEIVKWTTKRTTERTSSAPPLSGPRIFPENDPETFNYWDLMPAGYREGELFTDIGTQTGLMISPASFRKHLKPMFMFLFRKVRDAGSIAALSSDGCILEIVDDMVECGLNIHDPQLRANGIDAMYDPRGGLMLQAGVFGEVPMRNIEAICDAFEVIYF